MTINKTNLPGSQIAKAIERVLAAGGFAMLVTVVEAPDNIGAKLLVEETGATTGSLGTESLDQVLAEFAKRFRESAAEAQTFRIADFAPQLTEWSKAKILCERIEPEPRIVVCGAGHVGAALAQLASLIGYRTTLIDDRAEFVTRERFPSALIEVVAAANWTVAVRAAVGNGRGIAVAVVTRGHNEDEECMQAIMTTSADYVGLIGSKRRTNIVHDRLRQSGANAERLRKVHAPIGLDIGAVTPEEVALAILAEIIAERRGGKGDSLSAWRRRPTE
jgi:xanthine dehydrogenase accessory factor